MSKTNERAPWANANREWWSAAFPSHFASDFYDVEAFVANKQALTLGADDVHMLGSVKDLRLLHLQCNFGLDTLSFSRLGAHVTGTDVCAEALEAAATLAGRCDIAARFRQWDANGDDLKKVFKGENFDVVTVSYGAMEWVEDLNDYFSQAASILSPGCGVLHIAEVHPVAKWMLRRLGNPTVHYGDAGVDAEVGASYANGMKFGTVRALAHSLTDIIAAVLNAGLRITRFQEKTTSSYRFHRNMIPVGDRWAWPKVDAGAPLVFSLLAVSDSPSRAVKTKDEPEDNDQ